MSKIGKREVPMTRSQQRRLLGDHLSFAAAEAYKLLRTNLMFALPDSGGCRVVGVTSALQGEGKSTTSMNTAYTIAETGQRVLLIEADMRLPNVARCLGLRPALCRICCATEKTACCTPPETRRRCIAGSGCCWMTPACSSGWAARRTAP